jgi:hypothetical protein
MLTPASNFNASFLRDKKQSENEADYSFPFLIRLGTSRAVTLLPLHASMALTAINLPTQ